MKIPSLLLILLAFALCCCNFEKHTWKYELRKLSKDSLIKNNYDNWELVNIEHYTNSVIYHIFKEDGDTSKQLFFYRDESLVRVVEYTKMYPAQNGETWFLKMKSPVDTFYCYKQYKGVKTFVVGEYGYRFNHMLLGGNELDYYWDHEDSLKKIRGSNLPKLPGKKK